MLTTTNLTTTNSSKTISNHELKHKILIAKQKYFINKINSRFDTFRSIIYKFDVHTTRFNNNTYFELVRYKQNVSNSTDSPMSIYGVPYPMSPDIEIFKYLFILEMNNTNDKIMGIGLIKNILAKEQNIQIFNQTERNKFIYKSNFHVPLIDIHTSDYFHNIPSQFIQFIQKVVEPKCFLGKSHLKRGGSFTRFPIKLLNRNFIIMLLKLFIIVNPNNFNLKIIQKL